MIDEQPLEASFTTLLADIQALRQTLNRTIVGQADFIDEVVITLLAGGHCLIEGLPGLGKTQLAKAIAGRAGLGFKRIQCTPDLMPSDITGSEILINTPERRELEFHPGPIFSPMVLVDEINRATPRTQAALLEAMQEGQVTQGGTSYPLPQPFWVIATQNPIDLEGTYPLPEAQLDRFLAKIRVGYPSAEAMLEMLTVSLDGDPASAAMTPVLDPSRLARIMACARESVIAAAHKQMAVDMVLATHPERTEASTMVRRHVRCGASPRGLQSLLKAARVVALLDGRVQVDRDDLCRVALPVLRHRILLTMEAELEGIEADTILSELIETCRDRARDSR